MSMNQFAELDSPLGKDLLFLQLNADEAINKPYTYTITALSAKSNLDFNELLGQHVTVRMHVSPEVSSDPRCFDGIVEQVSLMGQNGRFFQYSITARPWFWFLSQTIDCKVFQDQTVLQIVEEVLKDHPIAVIADRTTASFTPWVYCVQYRETDFNFLSRLMEQEGIGYYFAHAAGKHTLVMFDSISGHDLCPGCDALPVRYQHNSQSTGQECVSEFSCMQRVQPGATVIQDYDFTRSKTDLRQSRSAPGAHALGDMEVFEYPGFYDKNADGDHFVRAQMEEFACAAKSASGESNARSLACGGLINVKGSLRESDNTEYLVLAASIIVKQRHPESSGTNDASGYRCRFGALQTSVPFRSSRKTHKPVVQGPQTAVVVGPAGDEIHTDSYGRVKVQFHWDRYGQKNDKSSCWVRVSSPWAGKSFGFVQVPRIGQEVVVDFLEGDPDQPLITGRVYNAEQMPPWELPANATQSGVLSRSSKDGAYGNANALRFEDKKGEEQLWLHAEKDQLTEVENDEKKWVGRDRVKDIDRHETTTVKGNRTETVNLDETITIHKNRAERVDLDEKVSIGMNRSEDVALNETISIGVNRSEVVGANETIGIGANRSEVVGGMQTETISRADIQNVGLAKMLNVGLGYSINVGGAMNTAVALAQLEEVGLMKSITVGQDFSTTVGKNYSAKVGASYTLEATDDITLKVGKSTLVMKADGTVLINGATFDFSASGPVQISGKDIDLN